MIKLLEKSAAEGLLPIKVSNTSIVEVDGLILTSISPLKNKTEKLADHLKNPMDYLFRIRGVQLERGHASIVVWAAYPFSGSKA